MTVELNDLTEGLLVKVLGFEAAMFLVRNLKSWFQGKVSKPLIKSRKMVIWI